MAKIFLADDDPAMIHIVEKVLGGDGHTVIARQSGASALDFLKSSETKFDLLILDINMPGCSGLEVASALRKVDRFKLTPLMFLTAERHKSVAQRAQSTNALVYLLKPLSPDLLRINVAGILNRMKSSEAA